ncbi:MAG: glycosyl hydrolase [Burkholderiaceae bacterium]|nr:glycosyl hydrolase [Burkholderiaceae bacterium]
MIKRALGWALVACTVAGSVVGLATAAADNVTRDVLDTPAVKSPLASRTLVNGLARSGERIVAVGQRGHVLLSDDQGKTWRQADVPVSSDLVAVAFPTPTNGWAVGHDGVVLRSTDAGATWTRALDGRQAGALMVDWYKREGATIGDAAKAEAMLKEAERFAAQGAENPFLDVGFENEKTGYLVGAFGLLLRTVDGGASWQPMLHAADNPKAQHLYAVRAVGSDVFVAGEQGLLMKLDRSNAASPQFRAVELPYKGTLFGVTGNARAVIAHGLRGTVLRSTDAGRSWQTVETGLQVGLTGSSIDADGRIVIVSQAGHLLLSKDDGASFAPAQVDKPLPGAAVAFAGAASVIVGGPRGVAALALK